MLIIVKMDKKEKNNEKNLTLNKFYDNIILRNYLHMGFVRPKLHILICKKIIKYKFLFWKGAFRIESKENFIIAYRYDDASHKCSFIC